MRLPFCQWLGGWVAAQKGEGGTWTWELQSSPALNLAPEAPIWDIPSDCGTIRSAIPWRKEETGGTGGTQEHTGQAIARGTHAAVGAGQCEVPRWGYLFRGSNVGDRGNARFGMDTASVMRMPNGPN